MTVNPVISCRVILRALFALVVSATSLWGQTGWVWTQKTNAPVANWYCLATSADGGKLAAVVLGGGIYTSTNAGTTWRQTAAPNQNWVSVASSADGSKLAAVVFGGGIYTSTNAGVTWRLAGAPNNQYWASIAMSSDGTKLAAADNASGTSGGYINGGIYVSTNSGISWKLTSAPDQPWNVLASSANGTMLVAAVWTGGLYTSTNSGNSWVLASNALTSAAWASVTASADGTKQVAAVEGDGIYISTDAGTSWTLTSAPATNWLSVASSSDGTKLVACVGYGGGIYTSTDSGVTWAQTTAMNANWYSVVSSTNGIVLAGAVYGGGIYLSTIVPPVIAISPASRTNIAGSTATFTVTTSSGTAPINYTWYKGATNLTDGGNVSGSATPTLILSSVQDADAANFLVVLTNSLGSVTSAVAMLTVWDKPAITLQPTNQTRIAGATATFSVAATGTAPLNYSWHRGTNVLTDGGNISGAATATLTLNNVQDVDATNYAVVITNVAGTVTSAATKLTVIDPPVITTNPVNQTKTAGGTATFTVAATGSNLNYQWRTNAIAIPGATNTTLTMKNVQDSNGADYVVYDVVVTNLAGSAVSSVAILTVIDPPVIVTQPASQTNLAGATATFSVTATGTALTYQWRKKSLSIPGATNAMLTLNYLQAADAAIYSVVVTNSVGKVTSALATLTLITPPALILSPPSQTNCPGNSLTLSAVATGSAPLAWQWRLNGTNLVDGGDFTNSATANLTLINAAPGDAGNYDVVVANAGGSATSAVAVLTVNLTVAQATLLVTDGAIAGATVTDGGCNYTSPPALFFSGAGGSGAAGYAQISSAGFVTNIVITNSGAGYPVNAAVQIAPPEYPVVSLAETIQPGFPVLVPGASQLRLGQSYQWQTSSQLDGWTNYAPPFTATSSMETLTTNWNPAGASQTFFRLQILP